MYNSITEEQLLREKELLLTGNKPAKLEDVSWETISKIAKQGNFKPVLNIEINGKIIPVDVKKRI